MFQIKRQKCCPVVPKWELRTDSLENCEDTCITFHRDTCARFVNVNGEVVQPSSRVIVSAEDVVNSKLSVSLCKLPLRDPDSFVTGGIHDCLQEWEKLDISGKLRDWLKDGVDVQKFIKPFNGNSKGKSYNSDKPPMMYMQNASACEKYQEFIVSELTTRLRNGSLQLLGKVGKVDPPHMVMPLTIEPSKPRLCHDEIFLNLWIRDCPFSLET